MRSEDTPPQRLPRTFRSTLALVALALALTACSADDDQAAPTFYVSPTGNDANDGTEAAPWATLQFAVNQLVPGQTLLVRGGVYSEQLVIARSGNADDGFITIVNAPGETPVIDGSDLDVQRGFSALVLIRNQSFVRFEGFELRNFRSELGRRNPVGIFVSGSGSNIELVGNDVHHIEALAVNAQRDGHGIAVYGTSEIPITDITIEANEVHHLTLGTSEAVVINGNVDGFAVVGNEVHHNDNIGIDIIGFEGKAPNPEDDRARNGVVSNNYVHHIDTLENTSYGERNAGGIYVDGGTSVVIEGNVIHDSNIGIEIASEHATGSTSDIIVRDNLVFANHVMGIAMGGYDENRGRTEGCSIVNNTLVGNDTDQTGSGELLLQFDVVNNTVTNNVIVAGTQGVLVANPFQENSGNILDNNLFFSSGTPIWQWQTIDAASIEEFRELTGGGADSAVADPSFANPATFDFRSETTNRGATNDTLQRAFDLLNR